MKLKSSFIILIFQISVTFSQAQSNYSNAIPFNSIKPTVDPFNSIKPTTEIIVNDTPGLMGLNESLYLEETINPDAYIVGPGDEFAFNMISSDGSIILPLIISPIGEVLIPNIGNINVDNMILEDAINKS